jgi:membrane fusion protein, heavy metal efflux system
MNIRRLAQASVAIATLGAIAFYISTSVHSDVAVDLPEIHAARPETRSPGVVDIAPARIAAESIEAIPIAIGSLRRHLTVPGTIAPDADRVARVPARVVGTVAQMRRRLGDDVKAGETVAVLDSREVADTKSEYLIAPVNLALQKTLYERAKGLWDKRISAENQYLQIRNTFTETRLRADLARQKLSALGIDAVEVGATMRDKPESADLRQYELRAPISGRIVERKVDVGTAVGKEGDPADVYTIADLSTLWIELSVPTTELGGVREGAPVDIVTGGEQAQRGEARIVFISPLLNQDTRSARVIATLRNADLRCRTGIERRRGRAP